MVSLVLQHEERFAAYHEPDQTRPLRGRRRLRHRQRELRGPGSLSPAARLLLQLAVPALSVRPRRGNDLADRVRGPADEPPPAEAPARRRLMTRPRSAALALAAAL